MFHALNTVYLMKSDLHTCVIIAPSHQLLNALWHPNCHDNLQASLFGLHRPQQICCSA